VISWMAGPSPAMNVLGTKSEKQLMADEDILFGHEDGLATVTLNRPQALNAFTLDMYRRFDPILSGWADDPAIKAVLIRGAG